MRTMAKYKVYVGTDTSQQLAVKVLEHSIKKHASEDIDVIPMCDLPTPLPKLVRNQQRTGFSFSRFCIPQFMQYSGKAVYLDADMLVFSDIMELFNWPMGKHTVIIQKPLEHRQAETKRKIGAPSKRIRQCSVMIIDCERNSWNIEKIISDLDAGSYNYEQLMYELCILNDDEIGEELPFSWNSLENYDKETKLIHYTDMKTQPWVNANNKYGFTWFAEVREMLSDGSLTEAELKAEIDKAYFRPSLIWDIRYHHIVPRPMLAIWTSLLTLLDIFAGYKPHRVVYERSARIKKALREEKAHSV